METNFDNRSTVFLSSLLVLATLAVAACAPPEQSEARATPEYQVVEVKDLSVGVTRRLNIRVSIPRHYSRDEIEAIARAIVDATTRKQKVSAVSIMFYGPETAVNGAWDVAAVDWAPYGDWSKASEVTAGDYRNFRYSVTYRQELKRTPIAEALPIASKRGLLGAPLPRGAILTSQTPGDVSSGSDPTQTYRIDASAEALADFFLREMPRHGWLKDGASRESILIFQKDDLVVGIIIEREGGSFTLMGS